MDNKKLKIYFCGSIRGVSADHETYQLIVNLLQKYGQVMTIHVAYPEMEKVDNDRQIFERDYKWFKESDIMVAEVTSPSHGVGMEIGWATERENYSILCLSKKIKQYQTSGLISGCPKIIYNEYENEIDLKQIITSFMDSLLLKK